MPAQRHTWGLREDPLRKLCGQRATLVRMDYPQLLHHHLVHCYLDKCRLQRIIRSAEKVIGCSLPLLQDLYASRTLRRAGRIQADLSHPDTDSL